MIWLNHVIVKECWCMTNLSENVLANVSGGVRNFKDLSTDGKVVTCSCAAVCAASFLAFCAVTCKEVIKKII